MSGFGEPKPVERIKVLPQKTIRKVASKHGQKCRKLVFMRVSGICFIEWL